MLTGLFYGVVEGAPRIPGLPEGCRHLRDGRRGVGAAQGPFVEAVVDRAGEDDERGELADGDAEGHRHGGATGDAGPAPVGCAAGPATSPASTAQSATTAPAAASSAWVDRSWRSSGSRGCPPPSQVSGRSIRDTNERGSAIGSVILWAHISSKHLQVSQASRAGYRHTESKRPAWWRLFTAQRGGCGSHHRDATPGAKLLRREQISGRSGRGHETV